MPRSDRRARDPGPSSSRSFYEGRASWSPVPPQTGRTLTGDLGTWIRVAGRTEESAGVLRFPIDWSNVYRYRLPEVRVVRYDPDTHSFEPVPACGFGRDQSYVWARIDQPGYYAAFAPPTTLDDQDLAVALEQETGGLYQHPLGVLSEPAEEAWSYLGPRNVSGRMKAIVAHPTVSGRLYAGAAEGGLWRSDDAGGSWVPLTDGAPCQAISAIALLPDPASGKDRLWLGTGEYIGSGGASASYSGRGVLHSPNGGISWEQYQWPDCPGRISRVLVQPDFPANVWVAGTSGLWRCYLDGNEVAWQRILTINTSDLNPHPEDVHTLFAGTYNHGFRKISWHRAADSDSIVVQVEEMNDGIEAGLLAHTALIAVYRQNPDVMYGKIDKHMFRWDPPAQSWDHLTPTYYGWSNANNGFVDETENPKLDKYTKTQGGWGTVLEISPHQGDVVFAGGVRLYVSADGGETFYRQIGAHDDYQGIAFDCQTAPGMMPGESAMQPMMMVYVANDGGIWRQRYPTLTTVDDLAAGPVQFECCNDGLATAQFYGIDVSERCPENEIFSFSVGGSTQDTGVWMAVTTDSEVFPYSFNKLSGNEGGPLAIAPWDPSTVMWSAWDNKKGLFHSTEGGKLLEKDPGCNAGLAIVTYEKDGQQKTRPEKVTRMAWHPTAHDVALVGEGDNYRLYLMSGTLPGLQGAEWQEVAQFTQYIRSISWSPNDPNRAYLVLRDGTVWRSISAGKTWDQAGKIVNGQKPMRLVVDWQDKDVLYVVFAGTGKKVHHVYRSPDAGTSWQIISGNTPETRLPDVAVTGLAVHPTHPARLYVSTEVGPFVTYDGGENWEPFDTGLPRNLVTTAVVMRRSSTTLYLATIGRGLYRRYAGW